MEETNTIIAEQLETLPDPLREFVFSAQWSQKCTEISNKNNFSIDQKSAFENEVLFVLIGLELARDFKTNIQTNVSVPEILAHDIAEEVNENIFKQVADFLPTEVESEEQSILVTSNQYLEKENTAQAMELGEIQTPPDNTKFMINGEPITGAPQSPVLSNQYSVHSLQANQSVVLETPPQNLPAEKKPLTILEQQSFVPKTPLETKLVDQSSNSTDKVVVMDGKYKGSDPYREPV